MSELKSTYPMIYYNYTTHAFSSMLSNKKMLVILSLVVQKVWVTSPLPTLFDQSINYK